jgi:outer membrane receptor protein involved in Fe transport
LGISAYVRDIKNVVLRRVYQDASGVWIESPFSGGKARVYGLEVEAKGKLGNMLSIDPRIDGRLSLTRNWSEVDTVPGPGNRLTRQPPLTLAAGGDWFPTESLTFGASVLYEKNGFVRLSDTRTATYGSKKMLDAYALWTIDKSANLRLSFSNLLHRDEAASSRYRDESIDQLQDAVTATSSSVKLTFEKKL